jgi:hypothetical protein
LTSRAVARRFRLVALRQEEQLSAGTLRDRISALRWSAGKIGSPNITSRSNDAYGIAERTVEHARAAPIGRTEHRSGITAALHWQRTPATGALIFLFLIYFTVASVVLKGILL